MADISKCDFADCLKSNSCYRFLAPANPQYQSYQRFRNICFLENNFQWYWEVKQEIVQKEGEDND